MVQNRGPFHVQGICPWHIQTGIGVLALFLCGNRDEVFGVRWKPLVVERHVVWYEVEHEPDAIFRKFFAENEHFTSSSKGFVDGVGRYGVG